MLLFLLLPTITNITLCTATVIIVYYPYHYHHCRHYFQSVLLRSFSRPSVLFIPISLINTNHHLSLYAPGAFVVSLKIALFPLPLSISNPSFLLKILSLKSFYLFFLAILCSYVFFTFRFFLFFLCLCWSLHFFPFLCQSFPV